VQKPAEPFQMPFRTRTHVGPRKHVLGGVTLTKGRIAATHGWFNGTQQVAAGAKLL